MTRDLPAKAIMSRFSGRSFTSRWFSVQGMWIGKRACTGKRCCATRKPDDDWVSQSVMVSQLTGRSIHPITCFCHSIAKRCNPPTNAPSYLILRIHLRIPSQYSSRDSSLGFPFPLFMDEPHPSSMHWILGDVTEENRCCSFGNPHLF